MCYLFLKYVIFFNNKKLEIPCLLKYLKEKLVKNLKKLVKNLKKLVKNLKKLVKN